MESEIIQVSEVQSLPGLFRERLKKTPDAIAYRQMKYLVGRPLLRKTAYNPVKKLPLW